MMKVVLKEFYEKLNPGCQINLFFAGNLEKRQKLHFKHLLS